MVLDLSIEVRVHVLLIVHAILIGLRAWALAVQFVRVRGQSIYLQLAARRPIIAAISLGLVLRDKHDLWDDCGQSLVVLYVRRTAKKMV